MYESVARLLYASFTDAFEDKARRVGEALDAEGGMDLMRLVSYAYSHTVRKMEASLPSHDKFKRGWASAFQPQVSAAWSGVGEWLN